MSNESETIMEEALKEIYKISKKMKDAKERGDKLGYEFALKEHERAYEKYSHILYNKRKSIKLIYNRN